MKPRVAQDHPHRQEVDGIIEANYLTLEKAHIPIMDALTKDNDQAAALMEGVDLSRFNIGYWFYCYCLNNGFCHGNPRKLMEAIHLLLDRGVDLNGTFRGRQLDYTLGHVIADSHGKVFFVDFTHCQQTYSHVLSELLDLGLDPHASNANEQTPLSIATLTEEQEGLGTSMFKRVYDSWSLHQRLQGELKEGRPKRRPNI